MKSGLLNMRVLHVLTLSAFAFTQPLLAALIQQTVYLNDQQFGWLEITCLLLVLMVLVPFSCVVIDGLFQRCSGWIGGWGRNSMLTLLIGLILLSLTRPYAARLWEKLEVEAGLLILAIVIPCACGLSFAYDRSTFLKSWLTLMSISLVLFPGTFLWRILQFQKSDESIKAPTAVANPIPVVVIVFDEFSGTTLMNEQMEIDERCFPQFARLAETSTWYRNATTVSPRTDLAVPAILSGRFPVEPLPPLPAYYPGNLLELIESSKAFKMSVFEPVSRLCPKSVEDLPLPERPATDKAVELIHTMAAIYPRLVFTDDTPVSFPPIPKSWFSLRMKADLVLNPKQVARQGSFNYPGTEYREHQQQHFLACLKPSEPSGFFFFHSVLPHYPWTFLATGEQYLSEYGAPRVPPGSRGDMGEDWDNDPAIVARSEFQYRQQVGYVDRFIGKILDRLEATGLLDDCLLIVTADHGVSFRPGHSRRIPDAETLPDILSVPLFIKYPGQSQGGTDDRNVESVDLFPTIAEILGIPLPESVDGIPLSSAVRSPRKSLYFEKTLTPIEPEFPQKITSIQHQFGVFGNSRLDQPPAEIASHVEWHGRPLSSLNIDARPIAVDRFDLYQRENGQKDAVEVILEPRMIAGRIDAEKLPSIPSDVVLAVDGIVRDTGKTYWIAGNSHGFQFLLTKSIVDPFPGSVELFLVDAKKPELTLRPMAFTKTVLRSND